MMGRKIQGSIGGWYPRNLPIQTKRNMPKGTIYYRRLVQDGELTSLIYDVDGRLHLSVGHSHRYATWEEMLSARWSLAPAEIRMAVVIPNTPDDGGQVKSFVLHAVQIDSAEINTDK